MRAFEAAALAALAIAAPAAARADGAFPAVRDRAGAGRSAAGDHARDQLRRRSHRGRRPDLELVLRAGRERVRLSLSARPGATAPAVRRRQRPRHLSDDATCTWRPRADCWPISRSPTSSRTRPTPIACSRSGSRTAPSTRCSNRRTAEPRSARRCTRPPRGDAINGVEIARSDPRVIYLALMSPDRGPRSPARATAAGTGRSTIWPAAWRRHRPDHLGRSGRPEHGPAALDRSTATTRWA